MNTSAERRTTSRGLLYLIISGLAGIALIAAFLVVAPNVSADPSTVTVNVELQTQHGTVAPDSVQYYANGNWYNITTQDPNNHDIVQAQLQPGTYLFKATYNGTSQQKYQTITASPSEQTVYFHVATVYIELQAHHGILAPDTAQYYANGKWYDITTPDPNNPNMVETEMLPGNYLFQATYNGTSQQKYQTIVEPNPNSGANWDQIVYFHVATVYVELQAHHGILAPDTAQYYAGGNWYNITTPDPNNPNIVETEMLPGTYLFKATYNGTSQEKYQTIVEPNPNNGANWDQIVYFHVATVYVELQGFQAVGNTIIAPDTAQYYAGGNWYNITTPDPNNPNMVETEMLPGNYLFKATYNGTSQEKYQTIVEPNPNNGANWDQIVYFHAAAVSVELQNGDTPLSGGVAYYYTGSGWQLIGTTDSSGMTSSVEMLPGSYLFKVTYDGSTHEMYQTIVEPNPNNHANATQTVDFNLAS